MRGMRQMLGALAVLLALGCDADDGRSTQDAETVYGEEMPEDLPAGGCREDVDPEDCDVERSSSGPSDGESSQRDGDASECEVSDDCGGAGSCVAVWDGDERSAFACRLSCIETLDEAAWCRDDDACCDADATCTQRGYCVVAPGETDDNDRAVKSPGEISDAMPEDLPAGGGEAPGRLGQ